MIVDDMIHGACFPPRRCPRIELETPIVPRAVAECVCEEASAWLHEPLPRRWIRELTARANTVYAHNDRFRRHIRGNADRGRDYLWMFMRHWLAALVRAHRPQLYSRFPASFSVGQGPAIETPTGFTPLIALALVA